MKRRTSGIILLSAELLGKSLKPEKLELQAYGLKENKVIFEKEREFPWEVDEALALFEGRISGLDLSGPVAVSLGVSESPRVREAVRARIEEKLRLAGVQNLEVEVLSAYKQGFFWLAEKILPVFRKNRPPGGKQQEDDVSRPQSKNSPFSPLHL